MEEERKINNSIILKVRNSGIKQGSLQTKTEMIFNLNKKDIPLDTISECSNLTPYEVQKIINSN